MIIVRERGTHEWRAAHRRRISASDAPAALARAGSKRRAELIERLRLDFEIDDGLHTDEFPDPWAEQYEVELRAGVAGYHAHSGSEVEPAGYVVSDEYSWLGASPHGLIGAHGCLHVRIRHSLRAYHGRGLTRAELARFQVTALVCDRRWIDCFDFWDGRGEVPDRFATRRVFIDREWLEAHVLPALVDVWGDVQAAIRPIQHRETAP